MFHKALRIVYQACMDIVLLSFNWPRFYLCISQSAWKLCIEPLLAEHTGGRSPHMGQVPKGWHTSNIKQTSSYELSLPCCDFLHCSVPSQFVPTSTSLFPILSSPAQDPMKQEYTPAPSYAAVTTRRMELSAAKFRPVDTSELQHVTTTPAPVNNLLFRPAKASDWRPYKKKISELYADNSLERVMDIMEKSHKFRAT
jgi:hypothetical protein